MKIHKRKKSAKMLRGGRRGKGWGFHKKHRGKGSHGGKGMAGTGKKGGAKITFRTKYFPDYFGKHGFVSQKKLKSKIEPINLNEIAEKLNILIKKGEAKKTSSGIEIKMKNYKVLGAGECTEKLIITCFDCSKSAKEKIEKAGGKVVLINLSDVKKEEIKKEK